VIFSFAAESYAKVNEELTTYSGYNTNKANKSILYLPLSLYIFFSYSLIHEVSFGLEYVTEKAR
jgi:hypothetical protein